MIWSLNPGKVSLNKSQPPHLNISVLEAAVAAQPNEPMLRVSLAQVRSAAGQVDAALRELSEAITLFPDFVPARLELIKGLRSTGKLPRAEIEVKRLLAANPHNGPAHHHYAHVLESRKDFKRALVEFEAAQDCEPNDASNYRCCAEMLFRTAGNDRSKLLVAKETFKIAQVLGGSKEDKRISGFLNAIHRKLKGTKPVRKGIKSKKRR
jgi:predicted Zn-dependent protease